jgi:hypothetical protein
MELARDRTLAGVSIGGTELTCSGTVSLIISAFNCAEWRNLTSVVLSECVI